MRLEKLKSEVGDLVQINWHAYLLRPTPEERTLEQFTRYTQSWARPAEAEPDCGFGKWSDASPPSHSVPTAVVAKALARVASLEQIGAFRMAMMRAYFSECRTPSDPAVLSSVVSSVGVDPATVDDAIVTGQRELVDEVIADHRRAVELGISGVPGMLINDEYVLTGALELDQYRRILERLGSATDS